MQLGIERTRHGSGAATRTRVLFIGGSLNQTTQLHAVARELERSLDCDARFSAFYGDAGVEWLRRLGLLENTIGGDKRRGWCIDYLRDHGLAIDDGGRRGPYDLVVTCTDLVVPQNARVSPVVVVQEGILDPFDPMAALCKRVPWMPRWLAGTALTGQSGAFDRFCVASDGYRDFFVEQGVDARTIAVTGIPNFDDCVRYTRNAFPHRGYLLVCTSDTRETFKRDDRAALVRRAVSLARGRRVVFKLHPNEDHARSTEEILALCPTAAVYASGSAEEMIANADVVLTQWSSTAFVALALGKELHSNFPAEELRRLQPLQNGGRSAALIARECRDVLAQSRVRPPVTAARAGFPGDGVGAALA